MQPVSGHKAGNFAHRPKAEQLTTDKTDNFKVNSDSIFIAAVALDAEVDGLVAGQPLSLTTMSKLTDV